jgi:hypothetical protein
VYPLYPTSRSGTPSPIVITRTYAPQALKVSTIWS